MHSRKLRRCLQTERPLCKLLNLSISTNSFPNYWKIAKVTPLHNGGARNDSNNYRPISVLPILSKILEKHVASSLSVFLRDNNLLYELQSAFRSGHSTETALIRLTDQILKNMDNDEVTGLVFIDFRKAFDVIDHELLLKKLSIYGATPSSVAWFKSYLSERKQFISLGKTTSKQLTVKQGVPQRVNPRSGALSFVRQRYAPPRKNVNYGQLCR